MNNTYILMAVAILLGLVFLWRGVFAVALKQRSTVLGVVQLLLGVSCLAIGVSVATAVYHLSAYQKLIQEQPLAKIHIESIDNAPQHFALRLKLQDGSLQSYEIMGDQWQFDARFIKWKSYAILLGLPPFYQVERLSGRYMLAADELNKPRTVYDIAINQGLNLYALATKKPELLPFVDVSYGSSTYMPLIPGASYQVVVTPTGLIARPLLASDF